MTNDHICRDTEKYKGNIIFNAIGATMLTFQVFRLMGSSIANHDHTVTFHWQVTLPFLPTDVDFYFALNYLVEERT